MNDIIQFIVSLFSISVARYFIIAGIAFLLVYVAFAGVLRKNKIQHKRPTHLILEEIVHSLSSNLVMVAVSIPFMLSPIKNYTLLYNNVADYGIAYLIFSVALALIIHDTYFYWMHRLLHHRRIFRHTHLLHHKSTNPRPGPRMRSACLKPLPRVYSSYLIIHTSYASCFHITFCYSRFYY